MSEETKTKQRPDNTQPEASGAIATYPQGENGAPGKFSPEVEKSEHDSGKASPGAENEPDSGKASPGAENEPDSGKTFTQDEVNKIISERLARERAKTGPDPAYEAESALRSRENALACREFLTERGYPTALLEIFDTADVDAFTRGVEKLVAAIPAVDPKIYGKTPVAVKGAGSRGYGYGAFDAIAEAFKRKDG